MAADIQVSIDTRSSKWLSSPVQIHRGPLAEIRKLIPTFERRTFGPALLPIVDSGDPFAPQSPGYQQGFNPYYDVIGRQPLNAQEVELPVGVVSKQYTLVQHQAVVDELVKALRSEEIEPATVIAELSLTNFGERMRLSVQFPEKHGIEVRTGDRLAFKLECFNSVDGSLKFTALVGWLRLVCLNGLVVFDTESSYRRRHNQYMPDDGYYRYPASRTCRQIK